MNPAKLTQFIEAYAEGLVKAITDRPQQYRLQPEDNAESYALRVALKVHELITRAGVGAVLVEGLGFKNACATLKIDHSERGINNYLEVPA